MVEGSRIMTDYLPLPDGGALVQGKTCACGQHVTLFRGTWWNDDDDAPHDCDDNEKGTP
jgi:hypothetical protein